MVPDRNFDEDEILSPPDDEDDALPPPPPEILIQPDADPTTEIQEPTQVFIDWYLSTTGLDRGRRAGA